METSMNWDNFSDRLRYLMRILNVKQKDFAVVCGVSENYISLLVTGRRKNISGTLCRLICQTYGVSEVWLKTGEGEPFDVNMAASAEMLKGRIAEVLETLTPGQLEKLYNETIKQLDNQ